MGAVTSKATEGCAATYSGKRRRRSGLLVAAPDASDYRTRYQTFQPTHGAPRRVLTRRGQIVQVAFTVIGDGSLGAGGNTFKRRLTEMSLWLPKEVVVLVTPWVPHVPRL
jgi:hypothetical protein